MKQTCPKCGSEIKAIKEADKVGWKCTKCEYGVSACVGNAYKKYKEMTKNNRGEKSC